MRGAESFNGKPWNSFIRYEASDGTQRLSRWGQVRLVVSCLGRERCNFVVVWRMREASTRPGCVLTRHGCTRLTWAFAGPLATWPRLQAGCP